MLYQNEISFFVYYLSSACLLLTDPRRAGDQREISTYV